MKKVVVIGGGTGTFIVLSSLKNYPLHLTAVVSMMDSGGSTGRLRASDFVKEITKTIGTNIDFIEV